MVSESRQDPPLGHKHGRFHLGLIPGMPGPVLLSEGDIEPFNLKFPFLKSTNIP